MRALCGTSAKHCLFPCQPSAKHAFCCAAADRSWQDWVSLTMMSVHCSTSSCSSTQTKPTAKTFGLARMQPLGPRNQGCLSGPCRWEVSSQEAPARVHCQETRSAASRSRQGACIVSCFCEHTLRMHPPCEHMDATPCSRNYCLASTSLAPIESASLSHFHKFKDWLSARQTQNVGLGLPWPRPATEAVCCCACQCQACFRGWPV